MPPATAAALGGSAVAAVAFGHGFVRLRRRGRTREAGWGRAALYALGLALVCVALSPPVDDLADRLLAAHMLEHLLIGDAVPALLLVAVRGPLLVHMPPRPLLRWVARRRAPRALAGWLLRPGVAFAAWALSLAIWHVPALYDATLTHGALHAAQHACFVTGGMLVWAQLIRPAGRGALSPRARLAYAFALFVCGQALADTLLFTYTPLYPAYAAQAQRPLGLSAIGDQDAAGLVMSAEQLLTLGTFALLELRRWLRAPATLEPARHPFVS